eukprot:TRINITY_DN53881_c0_g1_i1.p1 TRINITY_DN53881_c0_g1~~TRINITY_DN53881_c0_g1_i1.p1  ORF type:complete len:444 (-),score=23.82 TRINITY_DN53881_c0_g1_i1:581-1912(-)
MAACAPSSALIKSGATTLPQALQARSLVSPSSSSDFSNSFASLPSLSATAPTNLQVVVSFAAPSPRRRTNHSAGIDQPTSLSVGNGPFAFGCFSLASSPISSTALSAANNDAPTETGGGSGDGGDPGSGSGGGGGGDGSGDGSSDSDKNRADALAALAALGRAVESLPKDLAEAVASGRVPGFVVERFAALEKSSLLKRLLPFGGFKERLLADDLFMTKVGIECGVGIFTKTGAEYEKRRENFFKELDFVTADVIMALIADFMLVWLPAPTVALRAPAAANASRVAAFFAGCPDNAFQVALRGTNYSVLQRFGAIARNGGKLLAVGTVASLFGCAMTNGLILARKALAKDSAAPAAATAAAPEEPKVPILATSVAYGVYMAVSSNLRYQVLAGVVEQRVLEPLLHDKKLLLSALSFAVRTGNTFLGSLLWVDYARWVGVQSHE